ncbi:hypothetical protein IC757_12785 [Wenzhouxiangella sp. AB-CW3]|uniref:hypothetical protein n=1 Tax=Wenzhouxiangella sp. AB-CW3 TaxID=2771012 RepID=UPI00168BCFAE|nr:hypothetical protein [Wenzhouxiangella sp. AB-CW3]QOC21897.1 hypothetical protein IC757_12785 [Wenzhouxiangella sp. AB-CW3]
MKQAAISGAGLALCILGLTAGSVAHGQSNGDLWFSIINSEAGLFPVIEPAGNESVVTYDIDSGRVSLDIGVIGGEFNEPLFCFDFSEESRPVTLHAHDANGHLIMDDIGMTSGIDYYLSNDELSVAMAASVQCFYNGSVGGHFGRFGTQPSEYSGLPPRSDDQLFRDEFSAFPNLTVSYNDLPENVMRGDVFDYTVTIANTGVVSADQLAFQEVFPVSDVYSARLDAGGWGCWSLPEDTDFCPALEGSDPLRFEGLVLPSGSEITFTVSRTVSDAESQSGNINLYAAAVNGAGSLAAFDTATGSVPIVGEPHEIIFAVDPVNTEQGETMEPVVIHVVDGNGNQVASDSSTIIDLRICDGDIQNCGGTVSYLVSEGEAVIDDIETDDMDPGTYVFRANPDNVQYPMSTRISQSFEITD